MDNLSEQLEEIVKNPQAFRDIIPNDSLGVITARYIFGDQMDSISETLFLASELNPSENIQAELINRIDVMWETAEMLPPDLCVLHVYGRKSGFYLDKKLPYKFCSMMVLSEFQYFLIGPDFKKQLKAGAVTKLFNLADFRPGVPRNTTIVKQEGGKATIKNKKFQSIVIWMFWLEYPKNTSLNPTGLEAALQALPEELQEQVQTQRVIEGIEL